MGPDHAGPHPGPRSGGQAPCPRGTRQWRPRTGSGSGSSWRRRRSRCWGPRICRRPASALGRGRLSAPGPAASGVRAQTPQWPREDDLTQTGPRHSRSWRRTRHCRSLATTLPDELLRDLQSPLKRALLRDARQDRLLARPQFAPRWSQGPGQTRMATTKGRRRMGQQRPLPRRTGWGGRKTRPDGL